MQLLRELTVDENYPQMRVASVGLVREAILEGLSHPPHLFASPRFFDVFGPIVFRPNPPNLLLDEGLSFESLEESSESARLVESLGTYYTILLRDTDDLTRMRNKDALNSVETSLLSPLRLALGRLGKNLGEAEDHNRNAITLGSLQIRCPPSTPTPATTRRAMKQQPASVSLPGTLPSTPSPSSSPPPKTELKRESSPTASEAETSAALHPAPSSSPSESSSDPEPSSSSDDLAPAHQSGPAVKSVGAYRSPRITANQKHPNISSTLPFHIDTDKQCPLAEVKVTKLKDCPMPTEGRVDDSLFHQWSIACHRYKKHSGKKPDEIMSFVADGMLEPRFIAWYHTNQSRIDAMTLNEYLDEFQRFVLPRNWQPKVWDSILASFQENMSFANWNVYIQNLNA
ncbi:hypothetical protein C0993_000162 [Termitomyces sp. T159_Od127]|nr:hypothetical protein C0993_000162 [Termitomyces sp. T159_Od127]